MSRQRAAMVRLLFLIISATFLVAMGGGVFAYSIEDTSDAPKGLATPSPSIDSIQESPENGKPPLIGGVPSEPPPIAAPQSLSLDRTGVDFQSSADAPTITIWHGDVQKAGLKGDPQKWVNIPGTVTPKPSTITYSLNGGPAINLRIGPDLRRLENDGDFNVDLDYTDLNPGSNQVIITAKDNQGDSSHAIVTVNYVGGGMTWTTGQTYTYDWATASRIDDLAQIVDGYWGLDNDVVKPLILGYDRLISIGDMSWQDYTVTVPITFSGIDPDGYRYPSNGPGVGVIVRWRGHFNDGVTGPFEGWSRLGALAWYHWDRQLVNDEYVYSEALQMYRYQGLPYQITTVPRWLAPNTTYIFKVDVRSTATPNYRFKVWDASQPEPAAWDIEAPSLPGEPPSGGLLLVAHHVAAEFGKVTVTLNSTLPLPTLTVNTAGSGSGFVSKLPSSQTNTYRFGEDVRLTAHPDNASNFIGWQGDLSGVTNPQWLEMFSNKSVTAVFSNNSPVSDDFSACTLNTRWDFIDPLGHSTLTMNGSKAQISVPGGVSHDMWTTNRNAPRIMQEIADGNFGFDVKFDSPMWAKHQLQGIVVEANSANFLRFNFQHDGNSNYIAAYTVANNVGTERLNLPIGINAPMYLRTVRTGDTWTLNYSSDGQNWTQATQFDFDLAPSSVGIFAGNAGDNPAMVSQVDYFFNTANPIVPQDNGQTVAITTAGTGSGTVKSTPQKAAYACNESVKLEAIPASGSVFTGWGGQLSGNENPKTINVTNHMTVVANFSQITYHTVAISTEGEGNVEVTPAGPQFELGSQVQLVAVPSVGYKFTGWEGDISGNTNPYNLLIDGDKSIKAIFALQSAGTHIFLPVALTSLN